MAGVFYFVISYQSYFPGVLSDDAAFILGARSLASGQYVSLYTIAPQPETLYWPGYPFFLAFFIRWCAPHWRVFCLLSIFLSLSALFLLEHLSRPFLPVRSRWIYLALFALHPLTAYYSGMIISEPLFITLGLLYFLQLKRLLRASAGKSLVGQGLLLAWIIMIRPIGALLAPATLIAYGMNRKWKPGIYIAVIGLSLSALFPAWVIHNGRADSSYLGFWQGEVSLLAQHLGEHWFRRLHSALFSFPFGFTAPRIPAIGRAFSGIGILGCVAICVHGFKNAPA